MQKKSISQVNVRTTRETKVCYNGAAKICGTPQSVIVAGVVNHTHPFWRGKSSCPRFSPAR